MVDGRTDPATCHAGGGRLDWDGSGTRGRVCGLEGVLAGVGATYQGGDGWLPECVGNCICCLRVLAGRHGWPAANEANACNNAVTQARNACRASWSAECHHGSDFCCLAACPGFWPACCDSLSHALCMLADQPRVRSERIACDESSRSRGECGSHREGLCAACVAPGCGCLQLHLQHFVTSAGIPAGEIKEADARDRLSAGLVITRTPSP